MEQLKEYLEKLGKRRYDGGFLYRWRRRGGGQGVTFDSKEVVSGGIFVCKGKNFRVEYLKEPWSGAVSVM